jgi:hypothetical protein
MKILKHIERKILKEVFIIEIQNKVNSNYFIKKINEGISKENNFNYKTNVFGKMTSWDYFTKDVYFLDLIKSTTNYLDKHIHLHKCKLIEAWGLRIDKQDYVDSHNHSDRILSGVLYLNDSNQDLIFPEIDLKITPTKGKILLFHPTLLHETIPSNEKKSRYSIAFNYEEIKSW